MTTSGQQPQAQRQDNRRRVCRSIPAETLSQSAAADAAIPKGPATPELMSGTIVFIIFGFVLCSTVLPKKVR